MKNDESESTGALHQYTLSGEYVILLSMGGRRSDNNIVADSEDDARMQERADNWLNGVHDADRLLCGLGID
jgi:hypothetical protein